MGALRGKALYPDGLEEEPPTNSGVGGGKGYAPPEDGTTPYSGSAVLWDRVLAGSRGIKPAAHRNFLLGVAGRAVKEHVESTPGADPSALLRQVGERVPVDNYTGHNFDPRSYLADVQAALAGQPGAGNLRTLPVPPGVGFALRMLGEPREE